MRCPDCNARMDIKDSRDRCAGAARRRRYECKACKTRHTTYERLPAKRKSATNRRATSQVPVSS